MLVLTRTEDQRIVISGGIVLTILEIDGGFVRIGVQAPPEVLIARAEVAEHFGAELAALAAQEAP